MLIKCCECGHDVSEHAQSCPNCGCPVDISKDKIDITATEPKEQFEKSGVSVCSENSNDKPADNTVKKKKNKATIFVLAFFVLIVFLALFFNNDGSIQKVFASPTPILTPEPTPIPTPKVEHVENMEYSIMLPDVGERSGKYTGETLDGVPDGHGKFETQNAEGVKWFYTGLWKNGEWNGAGSTVWSSGQEEGGIYKNYLLNGEGWVKFSSGRKLSGTYKDGKLNGNGSFLSKEGIQVISCTFKNGRPQRSSEDIEDEVKNLKKKSSNPRFPEYAKNPNKYQGDLVTIVGKVGWISYEEPETGGIEGVIYVNGKWDNKVYFIYYLSENEPRIIENERIELWGILDGLTSPDTMSETIPVVLPKVIRARK